MSVIMQDVISTQHRGPTPGPVEQPPGEPARAAIVFGQRAVWLEEADLLALINTADHQLTRMRVLAEQQARQAHPSHQPAHPGPLARPYIPPATDPTDPNGPAEHAGQAGPNGHVVEMRPRGAHAAMSEIELQARAAASAGRGPMPGPAQAAT